MSSLSRCSKCLTLVVALGGFPTREFIPQDIALGGEPISLAARKKARAIRSLLLS